MSRFVTLLAGAALAITVPALSQPAAPPEPPMGTLKPFTVPAVQTVKLSSPWSRSGRCRRRRWS